MSKFFSIIQGSTGDHTFDLPITTTPQSLRFTVGQKSTGPENTIAHFSYGFTDFTHSVAHSTLVVNTLPITRISEEWCITHYALDENMVTKRVIAAKVKSRAPGKVTLTFDRADINYEIYGEVD